VAASLCRLRTVQYGKSTLIIQPVLVTPTPARLAALSVDGNKTGSTVSDCLETESGTRRLLDACVEIKTPGQKFRGTTANFEVVCAMLADQNVPATVDECKCRFKRVLENYRRFPERYKFRSHVKYLREEPGATRPQNMTPSNPPVDVVEVCTAENARTKGTSKLFHCI